MIIHIMSDGTVRDSIQGVVVPGGHPVYQVLAELINNKGLCRRSLKPGAMKAKKEENGN